MSVEIDRLAAEEVQNRDAFGPAVLAHLDEFVGGALGPGRHHPAIVEPDGAEPLPVAGVAPNHPVFDQIPDDKAVSQLHIHDDTSLTIWTIPQLGRWRPNPPLTAFP